VRNIAVVSYKELRTYLASPMAYVVTAIFLALGGTFFVAYLAATDYADTSVRGFLDAGQFLMLLFATVLTMRLVAEEKKLGTWELLLTVPVRDTEIILGKFLGSLAVLTGMLVLTLYYPLLLVVFGDPDSGPIAASYLGLFLVGCASLSVGIFASTLTSNQIVSAVVAGGILFGLWLLGIAGSYAPGQLGKLLSQLSLLHYFPDFVRGVVDSRALVYYVSVTAVFLYLAVQSIEANRWR
jgi:gliding motility-associated transport system permease protein